MSDKDESEKTEEPTPERERKAREEGQFPRARDSGAVAASVAVLVYLMAMGPTFTGTVAEFARACFGGASSLSDGNLTLIATRLGWTLFFTCAPPVLLAAVAATAMGIAEAGYDPQLKLIEPKFERLDPFNRLGQLFAPKEAALNSVLAIGRVAVVAAITWSALRNSIDDLVSLVRAPLDAGVVAMLEIATRLALWATLALAVLAALEYLKAYIKHRQDMKMSRQELKEEMHQQEGDPKVKARQRARARELARRNVVKGVKEADVVVANPEHVAVALRYRREEGAPVVTAKGYDDVAQYIKQLAGEHGVPIVEQKPLARALAEKVKVGRAIPLEFYSAVAELLAFVYRLRGRVVRA